MAWTNSERKWLRELQHRKGRENHQAIVVEGRKAIAEFISSGWEPLLLATTGESLGPNCLEVTARDLREVSSLDSPPDSLAVFASKELPERGGGMVLVLDRIQDPGNAGTLLRMADWFGLSYLLHLSGSVDLGNPKTVQASMGSLARVPVRYASESEAIELLHAQGMEKRRYGRCDHCAGHREQNRQPECGDGGEHAALRGTPLSRGLLEGKNVVLAAVAHHREGLRKLRSVVYPKV